MELGSTSAWRSAPLCRKCRVWRRTHVAPPAVLASQSTGESRKVFKMLGLYSLKRKTEDVIHAETAGRNALELEGDREIQHEEIFREHNVWENPSKSNGLLTELAYAIKDVNALEDLQYKALFYNEHRFSMVPAKKKIIEEVSRYVLPIVVAGTSLMGSLVMADAVNAVPVERIMEKMCSPILADINFGEWFGSFLYTTGQQANVAVQDQLSALSFTSLAVIFGAGLVTSLSPCTLSVLPLTLGYIGAFGSGKDRMEVIGNSIAFSLGLATTLAMLGIAASFAGKAYGQIGQGLPIAASCLAIVMGLNLLEIVELQLPSFFNNFDAREAAARFPSSVQAYLAGLTFALAASPCSTPVLASILAYVATSKDPLIGGSLLLTYTTGYVAPLLLAASFAGALQSLLSFRKYSSWINPVSGALLLGGGVYTMLDRLFPPATMSM